MPLLNPFLRALFQSSVLGQALPPQNYVVLLPTTESLLLGLDQETNKKYADLVNDEDFLGSHVLRISPQGPDTGKESSNIRDNRGKAKTYTTVNSRTVIIKENVVYSNKGFRSLTQAQLLGDSLYYSANDSLQWLIYTISKPLAGTFEPKPIISAVIMNDHDEQVTQEAASMASSPTPKKKDIKTFGDLLTQFPMIARQMQVWKGAWETSTSSPIPHFY